MSTLVCVRLKGRDYRSSGAIRGVKVTRPRCTAQYRSSSAYPLASGRSHSVYEFLGKARGLNATALDGSMLREWVRSDDEVLNAENDPVLAAGMIAAALLIHRLLGQVFWRSAIQHSTKVWQLTGATGERAFH